MKYNNYNDYELIYMVRENDDNSRDILYQKYYPIICHIANDYYQKNKYYGFEFEDFLQEATLAFFRALINYNEKENTLFYTFITICIRRKMMSFCQRISNKNNNFSSLDCISLDDIDIEDSRSNFNHVFLDKEIENIIRDYLYSLSFEKACIFELKFNGFTYSEISKLLDMPISSLEFKNRSSVKGIKALLSDYYHKLYTS